eukprot:13834229-Alexandrium_andersonii.AAC.1
MRGHLSNAALQNTHARAVNGNAACLPRGSAAWHKTKGQCRPLLSECHSEARQCQPRATLRDTSPNAN